MSQANDNATHSPARALREPGSDMSDAEAINAVFSGDTEAFAVIVRRHQSTVFGTVFRILANNDEAEDATQETFVKAYINLGRYNPARPFRPWLLRIATNTAITRQRHSSRRPTLPLNQDHRDAAPTPKQRAEQSQMTRQVEEAVSTLPAESRELFDMRYRQELSVEEIGARVGRRPNSIAVALHRLRLRLRQLVLGEETKPTPKGNHP